MRSTLSQPTLWFNHIVTPNSGFREFELDNAVERLTPHMNLIFLSQTVMSLSENRKPHTENPSITVSFGRDRHVHRVQHVPDVASPVAWILHAASSHSATRIGKIQPAIFHSQLIFQVWRGGSVLVDRSGVVAARASRAEARRSLDRGICSRSPALNLFCSGYPVIHILTL